MSYYLGIDIGTGSTKAVALNHDCTAVLAVEQEVYPTINSKPHYSEQDPETIWAAFCSCIDRIANRFEASPASIGISSAMHSVIPVDVDGKALAPMITWADNRSASIAESLMRSGEAKSLYENTGTPVHAMSPLCKIIWINENDNQLFTRTHKFIGIKEFIWYRLFRCFEVDFSIASATGLFEFKTHRWHGPALHLAGISDEQLSTPVLPTFSRVFSPDRKILQLPSDTTFVIGGSDGCLANLGSNAIGPGVACLTIGTSGAFRIASKHPCINFPSMTFNFLLDEKIFICGGAINNGGVILKWLMKDILGKDLTSSDDYSDLLASIDGVPPGSEGLLFLPYLLGERTPLWNSHATGAFSGITIRHKQRHFVRAVIEGISLAICHVTKALKDASGQITVIQATGGFTRSREWLQILSDMLNIKVICNKTEDASSIGAALMAKRSNENLSAYPTFFPEEEPEIFVPDRTHHEIYVDVFARFLNLSKQLNEGVSPGPSDKGLIDTGSARERPASIQ